MASRAWARYGFAAPRARCSLSFAAPCVATFTGVSQASRCDRQDTNIEDEGKRKIRDFLANLKADTPIAPKQRPPALVIAGPSGVGKGTLIKELQDRYPGRFGFSVSHTTRQPRPGEVDGKDYHFTTKEEMEAGIASGKFLEHANVHGNFYGTSLAAVDAVSSAGKICILDIDVQGVRKVKEAKVSPCPKFVFIKPPSKRALTSMQVLEERLRGRGTETDDKILTRLSNAKGEIRYAMENEGKNFDITVLNYDVGAATSELSEAIFQRSLMNQLTSAKAFALVIAGPSGVGKGTIIAELQRRYPRDFGFSVSHTTRPPRPGEVDGTHYHFTTDEDMQKAIDAGEFLEVCGVHGKRYGTSKAAVDSVIDQGKICILDIDVQGVRKIRAAQLSPSPMFVFIMPPAKPGVPGVPDIPTVEQRLRGRGTEKEEQIKLRMATALTELAYGQENGGANFDKVIWNGVVQTATCELVAGIHAWRNRLCAHGGYALVVAGPSGVGKGTIIKELMSRHPHDFGFSVSHTTRKPRHGEVNGVDYHFTTRDEMQKGIDAGAFLEFADVHGNFYGTSLAAVKSVTASGKICILDIDIQGVQKVKAANLSPSPKFVFIMPPEQLAVPAMNVLEQRLRGRGTETEDKIIKRLENARGEMAYADENDGANFDKVIINDDLETAVRELIASIDIPAA